MTKDDRRHPTKAPKGNNRTTDDGSDFAGQKALAEEIMDDDREVLEALARRVPETKV